MASARCSSRRVWFCSAWALSAAIRWDRARTCTPSASFSPAASSAASWASAPSAALPARTKRPASRWAIPSSKAVCMARSFCCMRQRLAWCGRSSSAASARKAACNTTNAPNSSSSTMFSDRSTRYGGQNTVTVLWLLPANSATATATPNRARNQRVARMVSTGLRRRLPAQPGCRRYAAVPRI